MKLPRHSFAYYWALSHLENTGWRYGPAFKIGAPIGLSLAAFAYALWGPGETKGMIVFGVLWLFVAFAAWEQEGYRQVYREQKRLLENARDQKTA